MQTMLRDINSAYDAARKAGDTISYMEVAEYLGFDQEEVLKALRLRDTTTLPLDLPIPNARGEATFLEPTCLDGQSTDDMDSVPDKMLLNRVWEVAQEMKDKGLLDDREWLILVSRFRNGLDEQVIGDTMGITRSEVRTLERQLLAKIRQAVKDPQTLTLPEVTEPYHVKRPIHLLSWLGIPTPKGVDPRPLAHKIIEDAQITKTQRRILHKLLGTNGEAAMTVTQLAKELGLAVSSVTITRDRALNNIRTPHGTDADPLAGKLSKLGLPIPQGTNVGQAVHAMIQNALLTDRERMIIHRLLGTDGSEPTTVAKLAREIGVSGPAVGQARDRAIKHILMSLEEQQ